MTQFDHIQYAVKDAIATVTLNRPDKLNAFTGKMRDELVKVFDLIDRDDDVRAVIVTGAGRAFCAGADLSEGAKTFDYEARADESPADHRDGGGLVTLRIFESIKPVIAAINGPAVGIGATMTLPMDIRLCSSTARFGFVFARRGIVPEAASSWFLPRLVGISQALEWTYSGRVFAADEALAGGLVKAVLSPEDLLPAAHALAREIADNTSAISVAMIRRMMWSMLGADHPMEAHKIDSRGIYYTGQGADAKEGVVSFLEKRPPHFSLKPSKDMPPVFPWERKREFS
jgi:enoyl-CoA hydratase/carnithine racemase